MTTIQMLGIIVAVIILFYGYWIIKKTRAGLFFRAMGSDSSLVEIIGVPTNKIIIGSYAVASILASLAGLFVAFDMDITPTMGMTAMMLAFVTMIVGGIKNVFGVLVASLGIGGIYQFSVFVVGSKWQESIVFIILVIYLLIRSQEFKKYFMRMLNRSKVKVWTTFFIS
jgi:branched-chain amino acid transport system permease protein